MPPTQPDAVSDVRFADRTRFGSRTERRELSFLMHRLLADPDLGIGLAKNQFADVEPLAGGRSGARVFKVVPGSDAPDRRPVVVKISPREEGRRERKSYDQFVRFMLPAECRPDLLAYEEGEENAALCYAFVCDRDGGRLETVTDHLRRGDTSRLEFILASIVDPLRTIWYNPAMVRAEQHIAQRYLERYFCRIGTPQSELIFSRFAGKYFSAKKVRGHYLVGNTEYPSPEAVLLGIQGARSYHGCILHGDMNTDNIFIATDPPRVVLVDFQKTGRGHVYEDFVALEASIRINYPATEPITDLWEVERRLANDEPLPAADRYGGAVRTIRRAAFRYFGHVEQKASYAFAVAAISLRLMQADDLSEVARARIVASGLWAAKTFEDEQA